MDNPIYTAADRRRDLYLYQCILFFILLWMGEIGVFIWQLVIGGAWYNSSIVAIASFIPLFYTYKWYLDLSEYGKQRLRMCILCRNPQVVSVYNSNASVV